MKFTIFKRLVFSYIVIMLFVIFLAGYMAVKLRQLNRITQAIASVDSEIIGNIERIQDTIYSQVSFEKKYIVSKDEDFFKEFWEIKEYVIDGMKSMETIADSLEKKEKYSEARGMYDRYLAIFKEEADLISKGLEYSPQKYQLEREKIIFNINQKFKRLIKLARVDREQMIQTSSQTTFHVLKVVLITAGLALVMGILISFFNTKGINRAIVLLQKKTEDIARGKFEEVPNISSPPEIKALADDFNIMCERLKQLDQMKIDFISHVSHDLRTPLTAIREASSMLLEGTYANTPEKKHELLTITKEECERLIDSVNKILDLSRMEAHMMDYHFRQCNLASLTQRCVLKVAPIALRKKINLELKPPPQLPMVTIDEERIGQAVQNLIDNAIKYTSEGEAIVVNISLDDSNKGCIVVSVSDTGRGIEEDNLELIFDKFKRIDSGIETVRGTGLGLSIAKHIITAHGGKIWAESTPGTGSTFYFTLSVS